MSVVLLAAPESDLDCSVSAMREFHPGALPPTLQSRDYATALGRVRGSAAGGETGWNRPTALRVVVNESVVRARVGGAEVMCEQLRRVITSMRGSGLCLQVIPADVAEHPCPMGPFRLLSPGSGLHRGTPALPGRAGPADHRTR